MSNFTIVDDVFVGGPSHSRKISAQEVLGLTGRTEYGHKRFYSKQFVPFSAERDIRGRLIKGERQFQSTQKQTTLWHLSNDLNNDIFQQNTIATKMQKTLVDSRFKLNQINHFRNKPMKSSMEMLPRFKIEAQLLENKDYGKKFQKAKAQQEVWLTNFYTSIEFPTDRSQQSNKKYEPRYGLSNGMIKSQSVDGLKRKRQIESLEPKQKKSKQLNLPKTVLKSYNSLPLQKPHRNPELQQIERNVKVHFNHPELDRLKQFKKLQFKVVQNLQKGDRRFKDKIQEFRKIKERIKKEMAKC